MQHLNHLRWDFWALMKCAMHEMKPPGCMHIVGHGIDNDLHGHIALLRASLELKSIDDIVAGSHDGYSIPTVTPPHCQEREHIVLLQITICSLLTVHGAVHDCTNLM